jgi:hypothetical protein
MTKAGPVVAFRSDNIIWDFKNLTLREIEAPTQDSSILQFAVVLQYRYFSGCLWLCSQIWVNTDT